MTDIYDPKTIDPQTTIGPLLNRVRAAFAAAVDDALSADKEVARYELTFAQVVVLGTLHNGDTQCAGEMCKLLTYDRGAMSRMLDRLERKRMIRRVRRAGERRMIALEITDEGEAVFPKVKVIVVGVLNRFLRGVSKSEVRQTEGVL
jgi:MarR family transcriptional regulator, multiple antibiotic resistance protein MarR